MYKMIISDDRIYRGYRGPTHFAKSRMAGHCLALETTVMLYSWTWS